MNQKIPFLSAIIIAKDEEDNIDECVQSLSFCDEIIVIDNGSIDTTREVAKRFGARVVLFPSLSFAALRNQGSREAKGEWLLYVDADERVSNKLKESIEEVKTEEDNNFVAFRMSRTNKFLGVEFHHVEHIVRFMKRTALVRWEGEVHETARVVGAIGDLVGVLYHDTHRTLSHMVEKTNRWSVIEARLRFETGHPKIVPWRILRVMITGFLDAYIKKGGFRSGTVGCIESIYQAFSMFITYAKLYELQQTDSTSSGSAGLRGVSK